MGTPAHQSGSRKEASLEPTADPCDVCGSVAPFRPVVTVSLCGVYDAEIRACDACDFRQVRPRLDEGELRQLYPDAYFDPDSAIGFSDYVRQQQRSEREAYFLVRTLRSALDRGDVLEVGCALGFLLDALRRFSSARVRGIDVSPFAAHFARRKYGLDVSATTLEGARFPDRSLDVVVQKDLLEHVLRPREHLLETLRILRPGGLTWLITPNGETNVRPLVKRAREEEAFGTRMLPMIEQGHLSFFTRRNLERLFRDCGFEIVRMRSIHLKRGLRALGYLPRRRRKEKVAPAGRHRPARGLAPPSRSPAVSEAERAALFDRLSAEVDRERSAMRSTPIYFHFRHAVRRLGTLPGPLAIGLDFDCLLRRPR